MTPRDDVFRRIRGLYGLADADASGGDPEGLAASLIEGGCRLIQLRCKGWDYADQLTAARAVQARCAAVGATFIVNDHASIAAEVNADGVHVGQLDAPVSEVRRIVGPDKIIGRSTHALEQVQQALTGADYVAFGPVFATSNVSRPKGVRGLEALRLVSRHLDNRVPLVAIGGITAARLGVVHQAGAHAWAVIGAVAGASNRVAATRGLLSP